MNPHIRWMIRRDMEQVLAIEAESFEFPWSEDEFVRCLRKRNCIGIVAEWKDKVIGFAIYELHKTRLHLMSMAVAKEHRGFGAGKAIIDKLKAKIPLNQRRTITCEVHERNLDAQIFMKLMGFRAVNVLKNFYEDTDEDAYLFQFRKQNALVEA